MQFLAFMFSLVTQASLIPQARASISLLKRHRGQVILQRSAFLCILSLKTPVHAKTSREPQQLSFFIRQRLLPELCYFQESVLWSVSVVIQTLCYFI